MDWQQPAALAVVAATALTFVVQGWRRRRNRFAKAVPCGCVPTRPGALQGLRIQGRRGEQPRVSVVEPRG